MEPRLLFYLNLVLCVIAFLDILFRFRKNPLLKLCFLIIIASLFVMNYYEHVGVTTRLEVFAAKLMRLLYVCSTMLVIIYLVSPKIPRWTIWVIALSASLIIGIRAYYFNQIDIENLSQVPNQVFSIGGEFYAPKLFARVTILGLAIMAIVIGFYYYRLFLTRMNWESPYYKQLLWWIISIVVPFFLIIIFGIVGNLGIFNYKFSSLLFSFFSTIIIFSILLRPKFINTTPFSEINGQEATGLLWQR